MLSNARKVLSSADPLSITVKATFQVLRNSGPIQVKIVLLLPLALTQGLREGFRKKKPYFLWSFAKPEGGGKVVKKP